MAEVLSPQRLSDGRLFEPEWIALRQCVSRWSDKERLQQYFPAVDWARLLPLAGERGVVGQLAARLNASRTTTCAEFPDPSFAGRAPRLLELFIRNEVSALVTKGPVVAVQAYAHVGTLNLDLLSG